MKLPLGLSVTQSVRKGYTLFICRALTRKDLFIKSR